LLTYNKAKYLFTGDITPSHFNEIIDDIRGKNNTTNIELLKLPHHASYRSINSEILQKMNCQNFVISTNSKKHFLPNKRAISKIINNRKSKEPINFYFNYGEVIAILNLYKSEMIEHNLELFPNNKNYGYVFDI
tara:strand:- start:4076 stop:4477 length:402 start_codon:yes stop_codon:yes gene_type:complete